MTEPTARRTRFQELRALQAIQILQDIREAYDTVAVDYDRLLRTALDRSPLDRAMLAAYAELVRAADAGPVADIGCGPGRVTAHLHGLGVPVFGVDLSPGMIEVARRSYPELRFEVGSMTGLDHPDGSLGGIVAWYSTVHTPTEDLAEVFAEFHRLLAPGGLLLTAFKAGEKRSHLSHAYGHDLSLDVYWAIPERVVELLTEAGLTVETRMVREPDASDGPRAGQQAYLIARRPVEAADVPD